MVAELPVTPWTHDHYRLVAQCLSAPTQFPRADPRIRWSMTWDLYGSFLSWDWDKWLCTLPLCEVRT